MLEKMQREKKIGIYDLLNFLYLIMVNHMLWSPGYQFQRSVWGRVRTAAVEIPKKFILLYNLWD